MQTKDDIAIAKALAKRLDAAEAARLLKGFRYSNRTKLSRLSLWCAAASDGAYLTAAAGWNEQAFGKLGCQLSYFDEATTDSQFVTLESSEMLCLAFRGTSNLKDMFTDANAAFLKRGQVNVHKGFWKALDSIWSGAGNVRGRLAKAAANGKPIVLTGHSLGAALAFLAACRAEEEGIKVAHVITFGQPQVGDGDFLARFPGARSATLRFVNARDVITLIPAKAVLKLGSHRSHRGRGTKWKEYCADAGRLFYIDQSGKHLPSPSRRRLRSEALKTITKNIVRALRPTITYHAMGTYFERVKSNAASIDQLRR